MSIESRRYKLKARAEQQAATRQRIVEATAQLHEEVGPARTTVAEIARRAGVQRLTVYNHFPEDRDLFAACSAHWLAANPPPQVARMLSIEDPAKRLGAVLFDFYSWYRRTEAMTANIERDRHVLPALNDLVASGRDAQMGGLVEVLIDGYRLSPGGRRSLGAFLAVALDFWTWRALSQAGVGDRAAADLMVRAVDGIAKPRRGTAAGGSLPVERA